MRSRIVYVAPSLGPDVNQLAEVLESHGLLDTLVTRLAFTRNQRQQLTAVRMLRVARRPPLPVSSSRARRVLKADLIYWLYRMEHNAIRAADAAFRAVDRAASKLLTREITCVIAREDASLHSFRAARVQGITTIYQLPTAYFRFVKELVDRELLSFPAAAPPNSSDEFSDDRCHRKDEELELADFILCPSTFVSRVLPPSAVPRSVSIPFGIDIESWRVTEAAKQPVFLYVGNVSLRKGIHRLLLAWKKLKAHKTHKLSLIGEMQLSQRFLREFSGLYEWLPRMPREQLQQHYSRAQGFIFNALADGFGHVVVEAMACGTPVIASRNSGAPDVINHGVEGFLVDYGNDDELCSALDRALSSPSMMRDMGLCARVRAEKQTWNKFEEQFLSWLARN